MDASERWQSIAPASAEPGQRRQATDRRKKRQAVAVACVQCRNGKAKCDGTRPRCNRCKDIDLTCRYDVAEGVSRAERMKMMKRDSIIGELDDLKRIVTSLRSGTDNLASVVLARLRLGDLPEDVAKSLPAVASPATTGQPLSLFTQDSTDTSESGMSQGSSTANETGAGVSAFRNGSAVSVASPTVTVSNWSSSANIASPTFPSSAKGKPPMSGGAATGQSFLFPLFDREDYLLAKVEVEVDSDGDDSMDEKIDPRLSQRLSSPSQSQRPSPHRQHTIQSVHPTHLTGRQPIVNNIRIHPNLDLRNLFGNMPFSSNTSSKDYPAYDQDAQAGNLLLPTWAMLPINTLHDPGSLKRAIPGMIREVSNMMKMGVPVEHIIETHPSIAALFDEDVFNQSGILSKWAVRMVHSVFLTGQTFTSFGSMYLFWYLMRWMIYPSPETYNAIPEWYRPTPNQIFMPYINIIDFVIWPAFRDFVVQIPAMQERMAWFMDMSMNLQCDWSFGTREALCTNEETGQVDLTPAAKEAVHDLASWSVGPSFRGYVSNADSYVRIRTQKY